MEKYQIKNLDYKIGGLDIDLTRLRFVDDDPYDATHLFVIQADNKTASIYVCPAGRHRVVASHFHLTDNLVGGGSIYYNEQEGLFLGDYSGDYGSIPKKVGEIFGEQIKEELDKLGLKLDNLTINTCKERINDFWRI